MSTQSNTPLEELAGKMDELLRSMSDHEVMARIDQERAEGRAFGLVAESCRHELARRTMDARQ